MRFCIALCAVFATQVIAAPMNMPAVGCYVNDDRRELIRAFQMSRPSFDALLARFLQTGRCWHEGEKDIRFATTYPLRGYCTDNPC